MWKGPILVDLILESSPPPPPPPHDPQIPGEWRLGDREIIHVLVPYTAHTLLERGKWYVRGKEVHVQYRDHGGKRKMKKMRDEWEGRI